MGPRKGRLQVEFSSVDDLERIVDVIARGLETNLDARPVARQAVPATDPGAGAPSDGANAADAPADPEDEFDLDELEELTRPDH